GVTALPPELGEHVRECTGCRSFISRWNTIELRLQALREEAPRLSPDQVMALRARMRGPAVRTSRRIDMTPFRYAVVTATTALALAAMLYGLSSFRLATSPVHSTASLVVRPDGPAP